MQHTGCDGLYPSGYDVSMADDRDRHPADALDPADFPLYPPTDATGDVDLSLIEHNLTLTPRERLYQLEDFAEFVLTVWRAQGIEWSGSENS